MHDLEQDTHQQYLIDTIHTSGTSLFVYENAQYRWLTFSDNLIQGVMYLPQPEQLVTPICQALILFLLTEQPSYTVLNLGLGTAAIERSLHYIHKQQFANITDCVSVELSKNVSNCAKKHFNFKPMTLIHEDAHVYIDTTHTKFNVITIDILSTYHDNDFLLPPQFWQKITHTLLPNGQILFNFNPYSEDALIQLLKRIRPLFSAIEIIEFHNYKNIVIRAQKSSHVMLCQHKIKNNKLFAKIAPKFLQSVKNIFTVQ
ncbi:hypothetical protein PSECIP111854_01105 [Pseudoalteromonas sp. CIP111854]|uniref:Methyltransferase domain-containing protein n=1 Tax=Pseudoalteromonas holothuriae TaxID=2963714 RepID=A0A9W4QTY9_9GAMM|nr:hypothetical protein [Pseudoalteromonas sp. CIP111854]CAH9053110.1 hypothetical protein PSECIP111854_01105 [Pseudoalteromonas sp. CIP111854]